MSEFIPTPEQEIALTYPSPLLVLAGAGTGKTTVLTHRIAQAIASGVAQPGEVLALTFTDRAATEMAERLGDVLGRQGRAEAARETTIGTFHSFGGLVIRENLLRLGFDRPPAVLTTPSAWQILSTIFGELSFDAVELTGPVGSIFGHLLHLFSQCKDHLVGPDDLERYAESHDVSTLSAPAAEYAGKRLAQVREVAAAYRRYEEAKHERSVVDFGDHLSLPVQLLREHPEVRDIYRQRYRFVFVDEYQDTNHAQRVLLLELLDPKRPEIMVIGDDDQAIYRWRGAVVQNILHFHEESIFAEDQVKRTPLTKNRRSFPPILDLANRAISAVQDRHQKALTYHEKHLEGKATMGHHVAASDRSEAWWIARKIVELVAEARELPGRKRGYGAFAVLCRKRSLFEPVGRALESAGIPYELIGGTGFYGRWEIRDIVSYLRVLADPADDLAIARIVRSRRWKLSSRDVFHLSRWVYRRNGDRGRHGSGKAKEARLHLLDAILHVEGVSGLPPDARVRLVSLRSEVQRYERLRQRVSVGELVERIIEGTGYRRELHVQGGFDARVALLNLTKLAEMAQEFGESAGGGSLAGFIEYVRYALESGEEEGEVRPVDEETDTVKVMTVHQAKGLEFPIVFVPGLAERVFPTAGRDETDKWYEIPRDLRGDVTYLPGFDLTAVRTEKDLKAAIEQRKQAEQELRLDEERRLLYVAITRAERQLYFTRAHWYGTTKRLRQASEFWEVVAGSGLSQDLGEEECPDDNPNVVGATSETMAAEERPSELSAEAILLSRHPPSTWIEEVTQREGGGRWTVLRSEVDAHLAGLAQRQDVEASVRKVAVSCSGLMLYLVCPRQYRYVYVDRLPTRPSPWATLGQEVHRRIEELSRPTVGPAPTSMGDGSPDEPEARPTEEQVEAIVETIVHGGHAAMSGHGGMEELLATYRASVYGTRSPAYVEWPFQVLLPTGSLHGRIDRIDRLPGDRPGPDRWEVVDFKSGAASPEAARAYRLQLALYVLGVRETWHIPAERITGHLFFLRDGRDLALHFDDAEMDHLLGESEAALLAIGQGQYPAKTDSPLCTGCDYGHLCAHLRAES
ncbi:MAG: ATP-dependent helicase [Chloroflexi bacterium]|nr:ATP-dependent helicase [Chloroflexota bacterium]